jgi:hypothetical protein
MLSADSVAHGPELRAERRWLRLRKRSVPTQHSQQTVTGANAGIRVDVDILATRYLVARSDEKPVPWAPWRWRPFASMRLGFAF